MDDELVYKIALSMTKNVSPQLVRVLPDCGVTAEDFFTLGMGELSLRMERITDSFRFPDMDRQEALFRAREEAKFVKRHGISVYSLLDEDYPMLLREIPDAPVAIYKLGDADLDVEHFISIVGTRKPTVYGMEFCQKFTADLGAYFPDLVVASGLAFGIDSAAHKAALDNNLTTVAVVAHGLDMIYPAPNRDLARRILKSGGALISEYPSGTTPFAARFLERNRIVAGLSPLTVVVESPIKGGAMSTANLAFSYDREVMALPGRISDVNSAGTNLLIRREKAHLLTSAADVIEMMDWRPLGVKVTPRQRNLFPELEGSARKICEILKFRNEPITIDTLHTLSQLPVPEIMSTLVELEFDGIIHRFPGNRYGMA